MGLLVVEDYLPIRQAVAQALREEGYAVDETGDGDEGLWYAKGSAYDGAVLDIMLPGSDGLAILRALREAGGDTAVLLLSAKDTVEDRIAGLDAGADDYLIKPFALAELLARMRSLLRRRYGRREACIELADLRLDPASRQVTRCGQELDLGPREYAILHYLLLRANSVVSREELWEHVYDFNSEASSNVVDVLIGRLRKKIGPPSLIHTKRGHGYVLAEPT